MALVTSRDPAILIEMVKYLTASICALFGPEWEPYQRYTDETMNKYGALEAADDQANVQQSAGDAETTEQSRMAADWYEFEHLLMNDIYYHVHERSKAELNHMWLAVIALDAVMRQLVTLGTPLVGVEVQNTLMELPMGLRCLQGRMQGRLEERLDRMDEV